MSVLIVGSTALDSIKTPNAENPRLLGGSASHAAVAAGTSKFAGLVLVCLCFCSCNSTRDASRHLQTTLSTPPSGHQAFDSGKINEAIQEFGNHREAAFAILKEASNKTNLFVENGRTIDTNKLTRMAAFYGMGQLGKSVPEVQPFLWRVIYLPTRTKFDRMEAFNALKIIGFQTQDIPILAKLLASPASDQNILTRIVPETISTLIENNPSAAKIYLSSVEDLLGRLKSGRTISCGTGAGQKRRRKQCKNLLCVARAFSASEQP